jgi:dTDP-glucose 4,6-dehydratase
MKRVLLTGASGFVGSHVLRHLLVNTDYEIVCPTTFTHKGLQDRIRLAVREVDEDFARTKVIRCDFTSPISPLTAREFGKIDYVLNVASESHVDRSIEYPAPFIINNVSLIAQC